MRSNSSSAVAVAVAPTSSLSGIGIIVGIILCILQGIGTINIGWFWATFPFWICPAVGLSVILLFVIISGIVLLIGTIVRKGRKKRP